jgi:hypothetical protein
MKPSLNDLINFLHRLPTAEYIEKNGILYAFPEYDIIKNHNNCLDHLYYQLKLNDFCQKISKFIITFYANSMVVNEEIDNIITNIHQDIMNISAKIISQFINKFNEIIVIFNQILNYYNNIKYNNIKITNNIILDFNNLNSQLLLLCDK